MERLFSGLENQPEVFQTKVFSWTVHDGRPRGISVLECLFFQDLEGLTDVCGRMSAGTSGQKLPLWADFPFLILTDLGQFWPLFAYYQPILTKAMLQVFDKTKAGETN